jgi:hypothetical protein
LKPAVLLVAADGFARPAEARTTNGETIRISTVCTPAFRRKKQDQKKGILLGMAARLFALPDTEGAATVGRGVPAEPSWRPIQISRSRFDGPSGETQAGQGFQSCKSWKILFILSKFIPPISPQNMPSHSPAGSGNLKF